MSRSSTQKRTWRGLTRQRVVSLALGNGEEGLGLRYSEDFSSPNSIRSGPYHRHMIVAGSLLQVFWKLKSPHCQGLGLCMGGHRNGHWDPLGTRHSLLSSISCVHCPPPPPSRVCFGATSGFASSGGNNFVVGIRTFDVAMKLISAICPELGFVPGSYTFRKPLNRSSL